MARSFFAGGGGFFWILMIVATVTPEPVLAQKASAVQVGMYLQKNADLLPGLEISYVPGALFSGHPRFSVAFLTNRPSAALESHTLLEDRFLASAGWFLRPGKQIDPYFQLEAGYTRFDREDAELFALLDNDAIIASILIGVEVRLFDTPFRIAGDLGYSILHSSTVYPFVTSFGIHYSIQPRTPR